MNIDFTVFDLMDSDEMKSLLKSNIISWANRRLIKVSLANQIIKEHIPLIAMVGVASYIQEIINITLTEKTK